MCNAFFLKGQGAQLFTGVGECVDDDLFCDFATGENEAEAERRDPFSVVI